MNMYQLVGYASLTLISLGCLLFYLQLDVFACFLLVAEAIVMLFALTILMHLNYTNNIKTTQISLISIAFIVGVLIYENS